MPSDANERSPSLVDRFQAALSDVRARNRRLQRRIGRAFDASVLGAAIHGVDRAIEHSRLAAWFRQPPDDPVSVDLAESSLAGPLVALLGPPVRNVVTAWHQSKVAAALESFRPSSG